MAPGRVNRLECAGKAKKVASGRGCCWSIISPAPLQWSLGRVILDPACSWVSGVPVTLPP